MWRTLAKLFGIVGIVVLLVAPVALVLRGEAEMRNFRPVREAVLYRSGQLTQNALERVVHDHRIRTVISLRDADVVGDPPPDLTEEEWCKDMGIAHFRLRPARWWAAHGPAPAEANVEKFRRILDDPANHPILIHCFAGVHRTGAYCALFRIEYEGWSNGQAIAEMKTLGYDSIEEEYDVLRYLEKYQATWKAAGLDAPPSFASRGLARKKPTSD